MNKRLEWVDVGKYICIMLVMLSHLQTRSDVLLTFYRPFFLVGFFFLSGYVYRQPTSFKEHIIKKIKGLLVPWFIFSNLNILLSAIITINGHHNLMSEIILNLIQIRSLGDGLWFVAALFAAFIPFYFVIKLNDRKKAVCISLVLSFISYLYSQYMPQEIFPWGIRALPWHLDYIFKAMLWMVLGYYYKAEYENIIDKYVEKYNKLLEFILLLIVYIIVVFGTHNIDQGVISIILLYIKNVLGLSLLIFLSKCIKSNKYIMFVGGNTLLYFAFHGKLYTVIQHVLSTKMSSFYSACLNNEIYSTLFALFLTFIMSLLLIVPVYCVNRWFPWTLGRKRKKG